MKVGLTLYKGKPAEKSRPFAMLAPLCRLAVIFDVTLDDLVEYEKD